MSTAAAPAPGAEPFVVVRGAGAITRVTLNRPRAINALNREMAETVIAAVAEAAGSGSSAILLDGAGDRGFCGGGDIKAMTGGSPDDAVDFLRAEYRADYAVATSRVPVVGIMDGITMGGGIGLTGHAALRVVTERSRLAMPETRIGIAPDVGGHLLLAGAPGRLGELLAATSGSMTGGDAVALGFADRFVPSSRLPELQEALAEGASPEDAVRAVVEEPPASELIEAREWFDPIAERALGGNEASASEDPAAAALRLIRELEAAASATGPAAARAADAARAVRAVCPVSVAVTLAQLDRTRRLGLGLAEVLADDLRVLGRLLRRPDFAEGVRAQVVDKDGAPRWRPTRIEEIDAAEVAAVLAPLREDEAPLVLP
ncbi:enoyl-CoA hydratase/isomerase family protein [Leucobacter sp. CSA1]|uniref:3-hydroxyisobutyryl-CoA hydrolase n=1 Tax=Leucobacter chromiisoli TaxID=2796471 RepID=A0A934Q5Z9_9MICO|nr:enoyl-CoA hydratase/isomerase family protein [Leucobacter chromiisoli]MBK0418934.1 enoyl-CoA hydratase/isomerase family protein [Leucobacter chromiisoli]